MSHSSQEAHLDLFSVYFHTFSQHVELFQEVRTMILTIKKGKVYNCIECHSVAMSEVSNVGKLLD